MLAGATAEGLWRTRFRLIEHGEQALPVPRMRPLFPSRDLGDVSE